ncbi:MAG TPA: carbon monoxide dehydrogenase subunit G [Acidisphaera sp.]|nr:carbon monoxide dehydrogenase subunit G [Acidisphaera sp.]
MEMTGERRIPAPRERVWAGLNDPDTLRACIPGCETLERTAEDAFKATAAVKIGPIAARFTGNVKLSDIVAPVSYTISGEGQGGVAGFAKGGAKVRLNDDGTATVLTYDVLAQVGGKMAQLGARLIDASARQMADQFFDRFTEILSPPTETGAMAEQAAERRAAPAAISVFDLIPKQPFGFPLVFWIGGLIWLFIFIMIFGSYL